MDNQLGSTAGPERTDVEKLAILIEGIPFVMLTTRDDETDALRSRPMTLQHAGFDGAFWFFVGDHTSAAEDVRGDARVNLAFSDPKSNRYVSASGVAEFSHDREKMASLWNPLFKAWFPLGLDDPELRLLRVQVESADYWDSPHSAVTKLAGFTKAILTGRRERGGPGTRGHLELGPPWH